MQTAKELKEYWRYVLEEQKKSGLNKSSFCEANSIVRQDFFKWQRYFKDQEDIQSGRFVEAEIKSKAVNSSLELIVLDKISVSITAESDDALLLKLLRAVSSI